jgi:hypothetical protein
MDAQPKTRPSCHSAEIPERSAALNLINTGSEWEAELILYGSDFAENTERDILSDSFSI